MQVKEPVSFTVVMRMSRVPLLYTNVLEEFETSLPSGEIQWMTGSGSPLALHLEQNEGQKFSVQWEKKTNKETNGTNYSGRKTKGRITFRVSVLLISVVLNFVFGCKQHTEGPV